MGEHGNKKRARFFFQAEDGIRDYKVTGVQTCALPISSGFCFSSRRRHTRCSRDWIRRVLFRSPFPPRGRARAQVLAQAGGNPMALIELAKVIAADPAASRRWAAEPLPPGDRLSAVITSRFAALPERAQAALLLAAVADGPDLSAAASHGAGPDARALAPAEQVGLVKVDRTGLSFSHPLVRSAIYHSAPFARRAAAH